MAGKKSNKNSAPGVADYRHKAKRKNNPPAGIAAQGSVREVGKIRYAYNPHRPPVLRSDTSGLTDSLQEILAAARTRCLTEDETRILADGLKQHEPWLEWSGKREKSWFEVDPVALHIHERISTQAILRVLAREDVQRDLFADPQQSYAQAVQFYQHDVDWSNRMILGDSLQVMASLARREDLAGRVQMIYIDPPYGIRFKSNFQPQMGQHEVKDREKDLTREPEMVRAYRDTWTLGIHSYLAYLRDRLAMAKQLLTDTGSMFVQISDENLHRVRSVIDEVFGSTNAVALITFVKTSAQEDNLLPGVCDYLLWYAKDIARVKYRQTWLEKTSSDAGTSEYNRIELANGIRQKMTNEEEELWSLLPEGARPYRQDNIVSQRPPGDFPVEFEGQTYRPIKGYWKSGVEGMTRLVKAGRIEKRGKMLSYVRFFDDFPVRPIANFWSDVRFSSRAEDKAYVVQTASKVIQRCLLMTTDPGDLVLDPTCGGGTTAYVAEQWGRRWITCDTSRVALALTRQRLMTARFPYYQLRKITVEDERRNSQGTWLTDPTGQLSDKVTFKCKSVPHIGLKGIARDTSIDPIISKHEAVLASLSKDLNAALKHVTPDLRQKFADKLAEKQKHDGKKSITEADRRRWNLPESAWQEWEVPFDSDADWPKPLVDALDAYRSAWRAKVNEVNLCIAASAKMEELVDKPEEVKSVVRVTGPFTMEGVMPSEESLYLESKIGDMSELETFDGKDELDHSLSVKFEEPVNAEAYVDKMIRLLKADGVRFPNNRIMKFTRLESCGGVYIHAQGEWGFEPEQSRSVAVSFGPQSGAVTGFQVDTALPLAGRRGHDDLVFAGFSFDAAAQGIIQDDPHLKVRCHLAHICPDVSMADLLKQTPNSQIFTVFGSPRTQLLPSDDSKFTVEMQGVDIYNPVDNTILPTGASKVAAWFLDTDYDGRTFCITQAFFPDKTAWDKLRRALKDVIDEECFAALSDTVSLPFSVGKHRRVAVKVIDRRGNEVMRVHHLQDGEGVNDAQGS